MVCSDAFLFTGMFWRQNQGKTDQSKRKHPSKPLILETACCISHKILHIVRDHHSLASDKENGRMGSLSFTFFSNHANIPEVPGFDFSLSYPYISCYILHPCCYTYKLAATLCCRDTNDGEFLCLLLGLCKLWTLLQMLFEAPPVFLRCLS